MRPGRATDHSPLSSAVVMEYIYIYIYIYVIICKNKYLLGFSLFKTSCIECKYNGIIRLVGLLAGVIFNLNSIVSYIDTYSLYFSLCISIKYELIHSLVLYLSMLTTFSHTRQTKTQFTVSHTQVRGGYSYSCPLWWYSELRDQTKRSGLTYSCC